MLLLVHALLCAATLLPNLSVARAGERTWWSRAVAGALHELDADWDLAFEAYRDALDARPGTTLLELFAARAAVEAGRADEAREALELAARNPELRAQALFQRVRLESSTGAPDAAREWLAAAREVELVVPKKTLDKDPLLRAVDGEPWFKSFRKAMRKPVQRYEELADAGDVERLTLLIRGAVIVWNGEETCPSTWIRDTLDEVVALRAKDKGDSAGCERLVQRARAAGRAADSAFEGAGWGSWVDSVLTLDHEGREAYVALWKDVHATTTLFRSHRFQELMKRFVPHEDFARTRGDRLGLLEVQAALMLARECLVEYEVRGYDPEAEWRRGWDNLQRMLDLSLAFGRAPYVVDVFENRTYYLSLAPTEGLRQEFGSSEQVVGMLVDLALHDLRRPREDRCIAEYRKWIENSGIPR